MFFLSAFCLRCCFSVAKSCLTLRPHGLQHARLPCPSLSPRVCSNSCPLSWWCHPTISFSATLFSSYLQSFPISGTFAVSRLFTSGGQSIGVSASASVLPMNIQNWLPLGLTDLISLSTGLSRVFSSTTVWSINSLVLSFLYGPTLTSIHHFAIKSLFEGGFPHVNSRTYSFLYRNSFRTPYFFTVKFLISVSGIHLYVWCEAGM